MRPSKSRWSPRTTLLVALLLFGALALRLAYIRIAPDISPSPDFIDRYEAIALNLLAGDGFSRNPGTPTLESGPVYPFLVAGVYRIFGESHTWLRIVLAVFDVAAAFVAFLLASRIAGRRPAILVMAVLAFYPPLIFFVGALQPEPLFGLFHVLFLLFLIKGIEDRSRWSYLLAGFWLGLAILTRSTPMLLPLFLGIVWLLPSVRRALPPRRLALLIAATYVTVAPWAVRNWLAASEFTPGVAGRGAGLGAVFWMGTYRDQLEPSPNNERYILVDERARQLIPQGSSEAEGDRILLKEGLRRVKEDPASWVALLPLKFARFWYASDSGRYDIILAVMQSAMFLLAAFGMMRFARQHGWSKAGPMLGVVMYYAALHSFTHPLARYSMALVPIGAVFASYAVLQVAQVRPAWRTSLASRETPP